MAPDPLSEMLALVDAHCEITGGIRAGGDWALHFRPDVPVKLEAVLRGSCWLIVDDGPPTRLVAGDVVVFNQVESVVLGTDPRLPPVEVTDVPQPTTDSFRQLGTGEDVTIIGGHVDLAPAAATLFTSALPAVTHASAAGGAAREVRRLLERIMAETATARPGAAFARDQYAQLMLLEVLRIGLRHEAVAPPGWLRLLADQHLRPAVTLMHAEPARAWGLVELAATAGMSRSHFAHRFREVAGQPPLTYLSHWRIRLAERALRESDTTVAALAERLGYASESSFSHAFARITGTSPSRYRHLVRHTTNLVSG